MYLSAAVVPPPHLCRSVHDEVAARCATPQRGSRPSAGWQDARILPLSPRSPLQAVPPARMSAHLTRFGYVAPGDADGMRRVAAELLAPYGTFALSVGGSVRVDHGRGLVLLGLRGETDGLAAVFHALHASVSRAGFVQDRRRFEPLLPVLAFKPDLSPGVLARTVTALEDFESAPWHVTSIALVRRELSGRDARHVVLDRLTLGALQDNG